MTRSIGVTATRTLAAIATLLLILAGPALARGVGGNDGSGLSPYAADSGNDRTAGVRSGGYTPPQYNYYRRAYGPRWQPSYQPRRDYYGYPN